MPAWRFPLVLTLLLVTVRAATGGVLVPSWTALHERVKEPIFAFTFLMMDADSLGTWTAEDLEDFADLWSESTDFPLEELVSLTREAIPEPAAPRRGKEICERRIVIRLRQDVLEFPMPYSILGYHPGKLAFQSPIVLNEWRLGDRTVRVREEDGIRHVPVRALTVLQVVEGYLVLDVDGWIDRLLGKAADDAWTIGLAVAWADGDLVGVGNSVGRNGRRIFGELNFRTGEIEDHGRPVARGLAHDTRRLMNPAPDTGPEPWDGY